MRLAIVIGREHGKNEFTAIGQPTDPDSARAAFHALLSKPHNFEEVQVWTKQVTKRKTFPLSHAKGFVSTQNLPTTTSGAQTGEQSSEVATQNPPQSDSAPAAEVPSESSASIPEDDDGPSLAPGAGGKKKK